MSPSMKKKQIPITREFLHAFYALHPLPPCLPEVETFSQKVDQLAALVRRKGGSNIPDTVGMPVPTRIDDCFWRNRQFCEDISDRLQLFHARCRSNGPESLDLSTAVKACSARLRAGEAAIVSVQQSNTDKVAKMVRMFLPTGMRGQLLEAQRARSESAYAKAVKDLMSKGGTIRAKYDLYLQHQWERRESLAALGSCSGLYKLLIKYVGGIPDELMDFARQINAKLGPMEEQRLAYGPSLYLATGLGIKLNVALALWLENASALSAADSATQLEEVVLPAADLYVCEMSRIIQHIGDVFHLSPFFISKEEAACAAEGDRATHGKYGCVSAAGGLSQLTHCGTASSSPPSSVAGAGPCRATQLAIVASTQ